MLEFTFKVCLLLTFGYTKEIYRDNNENTSKEYEVQGGPLNSGSYEESVNLSSKKDVIDSEETSETDNETIDIKRGNEEINASAKSEEIPQENRRSKDGIQNTTQSPELKYIFSVSIQRKSAHYTSGALVHKLWVLTSAAEFYNVRESIKVFRVRLGSVNIKTGGLLVPIKQVDVHPLYVQSRPAFDVALLKLAAPVEFDKFMAPITISQITGKVISAVFLATYWPRLIVKGRLLPSSASERVKHNSMRISAQKLIPWEDCRMLVERNNVTLEPSSHCLEPIKSHHSPCMPDAGAPVFAKDGLWGITSGWTPPECSETVSTTLFTRLSSPRIRSWLQLLLVDLQR